MVYRSLGAFLDRCRPRGLPYELALIISVSGASPRGSRTNQVALKEADHAGQGPCRRIVRDTIATQTGSLTNCTFAKVASLVLLLCHLLAVAVSSSSAKTERGSSLNTD